MRCTCERFNDFPTQECLLHNILDMFWVNAAVIYIKVLRDARMNNTIPREFVPPCVCYQINHIVLRNVVTLRIGGVIESIKHQLELLF